MAKIGKQKALKGKEILLSAQNVLSKEKNISSDLKNVFSTLIDFTSILIDHLGVSSSNSSLPPSKDPNRSRKKTVSKSKGKKRKPGGQLGHEGNHLKPVATPDEIEKILIKKSSLPDGTYTRTGFEKRQVFDVRVSVHVKEYQAEIVVDKNGIEFVADFPEGINQVTQYGSSVKATSVYLSQSQLIPLNRTREFFHDQFGLPLSKGSIANFNKSAFDKLEYFEEWAKLQLFISPSINADETGINIGGIQHWLHCLSTPLITLFHPDKNRGTEAMERMGVLPEYDGIVTHDHWKPYFKFLDCIHCTSSNLQTFSK